LTVQLRNLSIGLPSFYSSTTHKPEVSQVEFVDEFGQHQDADLAGQYGVQDQKKRAAGRVSHGRIAGQVGGWLHTAA
jgi:hypothetical protein